MTATVNNIKTGLQLNNNYININRRINKNNIYPTGRFPNYQSFQTTMNKLRSENNTIAQIPDCCVQARKSSKS